MKTKAIIPRARAVRDIDEAIEHYLDEAGAQIALGFIDSLEQAYAHIGRHRAAGSPRYAVDLNIPGLRFWALRHYSHLVFYVDRKDHVDVWRVLHGQRDIPEWLRES